MWDAGSSMGWWMLFGGVLWLVFLGTLVYLFTEVFDRTTGPGSQRESPLEIAKRRYAAGEITKEQYEQLRKDLAS